MGEVYLATDERLRREVAIKVLPDRLAEDGNARTRFLRESRLACKVVHPYVATVFDVVEYADRPLIVMERIDGLRFDDYVSGEQAGPEEVAALGLEIAEALAAIHRAGIVHRDLKPGNVLVTPEGHVKVTDFGVARSVPQVGEFTTEPADEMDSVTRTGVGVGTVAYMSPEQVRGDKVDGRSDLFALGIVLYEAVTGEHPFRRDSLLGTASAILRDPPGGGREHPTLTGSGPIRDVILRLLEKDPDLRYASAEIAAEDLRAVVRGEGLRIAPRVVRRMKRALLATGVVAAVAAAVVLLPKIFPPGGRGAGGPPPRPVIAVLPFEDETGDVEGPSRAAMVADLLGAALDESGALRRLDEERVQAVLRGAAGSFERKARLETLLAAAPANWVVAGRLYREADRWHASLQLYDGASRTERGAATVTAGNPGTLVDLALPKVLAIVAPETRAAPPERRPPDEALLLDYKAKAALRELRYAEAIDLLRRAVGVDPEFVAARARLAEALDAAGFSEEALRVATAVEAALAAPAARIGDRGRAEALAGIRRVRSDAKGEIESRRAVVSIAPDDPVARLRLALALSRNGDHEEALAELGRAGGLDDRDPRVPLARARILSETGKPDEAKRALASARELVAPMKSPAAVAEVEAVEADIAFRTGRYEQASASYGRASTGFRDADLPALAADQSLSIGNCELAGSRLVAAERLFQEAIPASRGFGHHRAVIRALGNLGASLYFRGDLREAESLLREAVEEARSIGNPRAALYPSVNLASLLVFVGRTAEAIALAQEGLATARRFNEAPTEYQTRFILADAAFQRGRYVEALADYEAILRSQSGRSPSAREKADVRNNLAWSLQSMDRPSEALSAIEEAIRLRRTTGDDISLINDLTVLTTSATDLGDWETAGRAVAEAERILASRNTDLPNHRSRWLLARGRLALERGDTSIASSSFEGARAIGESTDSVGVEATAQVGLCEVHLREGRYSAAERAARGALEHPTAMAVERLRGRECLARARAAEGAVDDAGREARRALEEAEAAGLDLLAARAAATVLHADPNGSDADAVRARGVAAWNRFLGRIPDETRRAVRSRKTLRTTDSRLSREGGDS